MLSCCCIPRHSGLIWTRVACLTLSPVGQCALHQAGGGCVQQYSCTWSLSTKLLLPACLSTTS